MESFTQKFLKQSVEISSRMDVTSIERMAAGIAAIRERGGRLFIVGVGGSAANASHAVNDFRKLCNVEAYAPSDNVSELTARTNDEGWETVFSGWLAVSNANKKDGILVFSVGGGNVEANVSMNIVCGLKEALKRNLTIYAVVGRDGGFARQVADEVVLVPTVDDALVTPHTEAFQAVVWHCLVSHPLLKKNETKW